MANPWFRMYSEFAHDPKVQRLSESDQRRYIMLLCIKCNGDVTVTDSDVAFQLRISDAEWDATKDILIERGLITKDNQPSAWDKRQKPSDSSSERVARHRAIQKQQSNGVVTLQKQESNALDKIRIEENRRDIVKQTRGTRLQPTLTLIPEWGNAALEVRQDWSNEDVLVEFDGFKDHWIAQPGSKGVKTDWLATWRNWCRRSFRKGQAA